MELQHLPLLLRQGFRIVRSSWTRRLEGHRRYAGDAREICEQVVRACWDKTRGMFRTSPSSYPELWARDLGRVVPALLELGFEAEVGASYRFALERYERAGHFALVVTPEGELYDFPAYAPDGLAFFLDGLAALDDGALVRRHRALLGREVERFAATVLDRRLGLVRPDLHVSEAQDFALRSSSCYSNAICFLLSRALDRLHLPNPLAGYDYPALILARYWDGDRFLDDARRPSYTSGDANLLPFCVGLFAGEPALERRLFRRALARLDADGLNDPLPTRYGIGHSPERRMIPLDPLNPWQRDAVWTCLGIHLLEALARLEPERLGREVARYAAVVERLACFPEVIDPVSGELFRSTFYLSEDSMLWAAGLWRFLARPGL
jgi:hypothetical protein